MMLVFPMMPVRAGGVMIGERCADFVQAALA